MMHFKKKSIFFVFILIFIFNSEIQSNDFDINYFIQPIIQGVQSTRDLWAGKEQRYTYKKIKGFHQNRVVMTDAFPNSGFHLATDNIDPNNIFDQWLAGKERVPIIDALIGLFLEKGFVEKAYRFLTSPNPNYWRMVKEGEWLKRVQDAGGWPIIPEGKLLRLGDISSRVIPLKRRLEIECYLPHASYHKESLFDNKLLEAVKSFQANHGLEIDGIVGPNTLEALNVSAGERRKQILINLERWRWLPHNLGDRYISVNIAAFSLNAVDRGKQSLNMRVIVGKDYQKTPLFSQKMAYIEFNPYWNVPRSIVEEELLPNFKTDPGYMIKNHYELVAGWDVDSPVINPGDVEWETIHAKNFPGRIRQLPGPWNAMGQVKFMFPNEFNVYLHDTSSCSRNLFQKADRALSHGCIRIEKPVDLAVFLLGSRPEWSRKRIEDIIENGERLSVPVPGRFMVHVLYYTAWIGKEGKVNYRKDIYGRDAILWEAVQQVSAHEPIPKPISNSISEN